MLVPFHIHTKSTCHCDVDAPKTGVIPHPHDERHTSLCATPNENTRFSASIEIRLFLPFRTPDGNAQELGK